jgi:hypothetical protein
MREWSISKCHDKNKEMHNILDTKVNSITKITKMMLQNKNESFNIIETKVQYFMHNISCDLYIFQMSSSLRTQPLISINNK